MEEKNCIFCQIVNKEVPSKIIYENEYNIAFLDIFPIGEGHTIVIPKKHYSNIEVIPEKDLIEIVKTVKYLSKLLHDKLNFDGYNILQNNFKAAGQVVQHFHFHIIPRNFNDSRFRLAIPREQASDDDLIRLMNRIKA
jgi:histidine triad (HIT) family protein